MQQKSKVMQISCIGPLECIILMKWSNMYIHLSSIASCVQGHRSFWSLSQLLWGRGKLHPGQLASPPQGHTQTNTPLRDNLKPLINPWYMILDNLRKYEEILYFFFNKFCLFSFVFHWTSTEFLKTQNLVFAWTTLSCRWSQVRGSKCVYIRIVELLTKYYIRAILCMCVPCYFFLHYFGQSKLHLLNCCILTTNYVAKEFFCTNRRQMAVSVLFHQALLCFVCSKTRSWWVLSLCNATLHTTI